MGEGSGQKSEVAVVKAPVTKAPKSKPSAKKKPAAKAKPTKKKAVKKSPPKKTPATKKTTKKKTTKKPERLKTKKELLSAYNRQIEEDKIARVMRAEDTMPRHWISTGSLDLDRALQHVDGVSRGIPCGRVIEIFGEAHIGKSTLLDHIFANVQRAGGVGVLLETDSSRDAHYTAQMGVNTDELQVIKFGHDQGSIENAGDKIAETTRFFNQEAPDMPVILGFDALGVTPTQEEISKDLSEKSTASAAKIVRVLCRKVAPLLPFSNVSLVVLNHEYDVINFFGGGATPKKTYGGDGITLLSTLRLRLHRIRDGWLKEPGTGRTLGRKVGFDIKKWKLGHFCQTGSIPILSGVGIDNAVTLWDTLTRTNIIAVAGAWGAVNIDGETIKFQGWSGLKRKCQERPELYGKLIEIYWQQVR